MLAVITTSEPSTRIPGPPGNCASITLSNKSEPDARPAEHALDHDRPASTVPICTPSMRHDRQERVAQHVGTVTWLRDSPLARAVRTKSSCETSSMEERMTRA